MEDYEKLSQERERLNLHELVLVLKVQARIRAFLARKRFTKLIYEEQKFHEIYRFDTSVRHLLSANNQILTTVFKHYIVFPAQALVKKGLNTFAHDFGIIPRFCSFNEVEKAANEITCGNKTSPKGGEVHISYEQFLKALIFLSLKHVKEPVPEEAVCKLECLLKVMDKSDGCTKVSKAKGSACVRMRFTFFNAKDLPEASKARRSYLAKAESLPATEMELQTRPALAPGSPASTQNDVSDAPIECNAEVENTNECNCSSAKKEAALLSQLAEKEKAFEAFKLRTKVYVDETRAKIALLEGQVQSEKKKVEDLQTAKIEAETKLNQLSACPSLLTGKSGAAVAESFQDGDSVQSLEQELIHTRTKFEELKSEKKELLEKLETAQKACSSLEDKMAKLQDEYSSRENSQEKLLGEVSKLQKENEDLNTRLSETIDHNVRLSETINEDAASKDQSVDQVDALSKEIEALSKKLKETQDELSETSEAYHERLGMAQALQTKLDEVSLSLIESTELCEKSEHKLKQEVDQLKKKEDAVRQELEKQKVESQLRSLEIEDLKEKNLSLLAVAETLSDVCAIAGIKGEADCHALVDRVKSLIEEVQQARELTSKQNLHCETTKISAEELQATIQELKTVSCERDTCKSQLVLLEVDIKSYSSAIQRLETNLQEAQEAYEKLQEEHQMAKAQLLSMEKHQEQLETDNEALGVKCQELEKVTSSIADYAEQTNLLKKILEDKNTELEGTKLELEHEKEQLLKQTEKVALSLQSRDGYMEELEADKNNVMQRIEELKLEHEKEIDSLKGAHMDELRKKEESYLSLQESLTSERQNIENMKQELNQTRSSLQQAEMDLQTAKTTQVRADARISNLEKELQTRGREAQNSTQENKEQVLILEHKLGQAKKQLQAKEEELTAEIEKFTAIIAESEEKLKKEKSLTADRKKKMKQYVDAQNVEKAEMAEKIEQLTRSLNESQTKGIELEKKVESLQATMQSLQLSLNEAVRREEQLKGDVKDREDALNTHLSQGVAGWKKDVEEHKQKRLQARAEIIAIQQQLDAEQKMFLNANHLLETTIIPKVIEQAQSLENLVSQVEKSMRVLASTQKRQLHHRFGKQQNDSYRDNLALAANDGLGNKAYSMQLLEGVENQSVGKATALQRKLEKFEHLQRELERVTVGVELATQGVDQMYTALGTRNRSLCAILTSFLSKNTDTVSPGIQRNAYINVAGNTNSKKKGPLANAEESDEEH